MKWGTDVYLCQQIHSSNQALHLFMHLHTGSPSKSAHFKYNNNILKSFLKNHLIELLTGNTETMFYFTYVN